MVLSIKINNISQLHSYDIILMLGHNLLLMKNYKYHHTLKQHYGMKVMARETPDSAVVVVFFLTPPNKTKMLTT